MKMMSLADAAFLIAESRRTPMHVAGLNLYTLPDDADEAEFLHNLSDILRYSGELRHPFGEVLQMGPLGTVGAIGWKKEQHLDMDYHIRHSSLPKPGRYRELFALTSRLHGILLDRTRPLWELHLIEGLKNRQFATYFKTHHSILDGVGAMHFMNSMLSTNAREKLKHSPFSVEAYEAYKDKLEKKYPKKPIDADVKAVTELIQQQWDSSINLGNALVRYANVWRGKGGDLSAPWHNIPHTSLNKKISGARRFVAQSWSFERVRAVGKAFDGTLNDAVLGMCAGALRRYLAEQRDLPKQPLKAMVPVSLRVAGDIDSANAVGLITANLGTHIANPEKRMRVIQNSMAAEKQHLAGLSAIQVQIYSGLTQAPMLLSNLLGAGERFPAYSTIISNVPGPRQQLYWNGARLDGMYPCSIPVDGVALNFTTISNNKNLDFGITVCRKSVPHVQRLIDYLEDSLVELEEVAGIRESGNKPSKTPASKAAAKKTAGGG